MVFDKDSYEMKTYDIDMSMTMDVEGQELTIEQDMSTEYKNINSIDSIEVPEDVVDSAVEQNF